MLIFVLIPSAKANDHSFESWNKKQFEKENPCRHNMTESKILLNGVDEGIKIVISSLVTGAESPSMVLESIQNVFPDFVSELVTEEPTFGSPVNVVFKQEDVSLNQFLAMIHKQAILDTALDMMSINLDDNHTYFEILRQASIANKIAFNLDGQNPLGGVIKIELSGEDLPAWIEAATWHKGRDVVPRKVNDERMMNVDGDASTWH